MINTSSPVHGRAELASRRSQPGHVDGIVAEAANRLPIPWFLCFRPADLPSGPAEQVAMSMPCTTVEQAVRNLEHSLPVLEAIAGDPELGRSYGSLVHTLLRRLPLPYVAMDPVEVFMLSSEPPAAMGERFAAALAGDVSAIPHLKAMAEYRESVRPYPLDVVYSMPGGNRDEDRMWNASVLDGGFQPNFRFVHWAKGPEGATPPAPQPVADAAFGELRNVSKLVMEWIEAAVQSAEGAELGVSPGSPEHVQLDIFVGDPEDVPRLENSAGVRQQIADLVQSTLEPWCKKHGFAWKGFRFSSPDWTRG